MAWLTPSEFETAVKIERMEGRAGFGALLAAAAFVSEEKYDAIHELWSLSPYYWSVGRQIADEYVFQCRFAVFLAAAALHADLDNQRKIEQICPGLNAELSIRYNTPGGLIPGEQLEMNGRVYKCIEIVDDYGETVNRKVVEVVNE